MIFSKIACPLTVVVDYAETVSAQSTTMQTGAEIIVVVGVVVDHADTDRYIVIEWVCKFFYPDLLTGALDQDNNK